MPWLFGLTLFVSAALLFVGQPMIAKSLLPPWGGSPSVWNTCMVFFQAALLAGYAYAHATTAWLGARRQTLLHAGLLLVPWAFLPFAVPAEVGPSASPTLRLLGSLVATNGLPFFVVSTTAPLLQRWFASADPRDPYPLYAASNVGSLLALLAYPLVIEPNLGLGQQGMIWAGGYGLLVALTFSCAVFVWRNETEHGGYDASVTPVPLASEGWGAGSEPAPMLREPTALHPPSPALTRKGRGDRKDGVFAGERIDGVRFARWVALAFVPSSWLLGVTTYLTTDIAPVPLLWVVPLALYLLSFILVFARGTRPIDAWGVRLLPLLAFPLALVLGLGLAQAFWLPLHLLTFFAGALVCHGALARDRPGVYGLTAFYLALAVGGVLGGLFNALIAPQVFDRIAEYPLALVLGCLALPSIPSRRNKWPALSRHSLWALPLAIFGIIALLVRNVGGIEPTPLGTMLEFLASGLLVFVWYRHRSHPARLALGLGAALLASGLSDGLSGRTLFRERNFFGTARVTTASTPHGEVHRLFHGNTLHGQQALDPSRRREPLAYFHRTGPIAQVFSVLHDGPNVAIVGLGAGSLAAYARENERWTFYEIDPAVIRIARDPRYFTFLSDSRAERIDVLEGDARLRIREAPEHGFGLIVLDAFSSDAVPTHLLTREALALYRAKLVAAGLIVFNITNRYLDLEPVIGALARDAAMVCRVRYDVVVSDEEKADGKEASIWAVLATDEENLGIVAHDDRWFPARVPAATSTWRDDFSDLASHLVLRRRFRAERLVARPPDATITP
ncbi:MAG: fused MFS/spermidine synthase [Isosphaeraceae bacterium]|nr:fused MFS/spermidine synthase [Isosphaeraceae bacterium]